MRKIVMLCMVLSVLGVQATENGEQHRKTEEEYGRLRRVLIEGTYHGENLVVQNPFDDEKGYCVTSVSVNGESLMGFDGLSEFEIDLSVFGIRPGESVEILIEHHAACGPIITNPAALK